MWENTLPTVYHIEQILKIFQNNSDKKSSYQVRKNSYC